MNFGLVKDSFCCNEISVKLIIKQTYIISLNTFLWLIHCYMLQFFPGLQFICFSALFHLGLGSSFFPPKSLESVLCQFPEQIHGKQKCHWAEFTQNEHFSFPTVTVDTASLYSSWMHGVEFTWFIVNSPIPAATMFICCWMSAFSI